ncbi:MAG: hypothetical protein GWN37_01625, partial [Gammaproteobacteria bacterium]|nr:hypothetical protein [Gammaproteobacteria bacterium]
AAGFTAFGTAAQSGFASAAAQLLNLVGCTQFCGTVNALGRGYADNGGGWASRPFYRASPNSPGTPSPGDTAPGGAAALISLQTKNFDEASETAPGGIFLVRNAHTQPVPEPSATLLFG